MFNIIRLLLGMDVQGLPKHKYGGDPQHYFHRVLHTDTMVDLFNAHYAPKQKSYMYWGTTDSGEIVCIPEDYLTPNLDGDEE
ncbi:hypothetical protein GD1_188 [Paraglaciecola Antarctic GD virus 1]|nr:hypothetical protein GD1_188 [Paraglaciecola Antarctic GD virus 1]